MKEERTPGKTDAPPVPRSLTAPLIERAPLPLVEVQGSTHIVSYANAAFCRLLGKPQADLIGRSFGEIVSHGRECLPLLDRVYQRGEAVTHAQEGREEDSEAEPSLWLYSMWPALDPDARPVGVIIQLSKVAPTGQSVTAINEALLIGGLRQHELTEAAQRLAAQLQSEIAVRTRAEEALRESEGQLLAEVSALARLHELSASLWRSHDLRAGMEKMLDSAIALLGADMGTVQLLDSHKRVLEIVVQRGFQQDFLDFFREVSAADDCACGRTLREGGTTIIEDVETEDSYAPYRQIAAAAGYRSVQSTPLRARDGAVLGMLSTHFRRRHRPSAQDLRRLELYARQAADFIESTRADETLRESEERFRTMAGQLAATDRNKDEFLAILAHELRNPLAPIKNAAHILHMVNSDNPLIIRAQKIIEGQADHLAKLVDDLLDVSRIQKGKVRLRREHMDLSKAIYRAVDSSEHLIKAHDHSITLDLQRMPPFHIDADPTRVDQILVNLIGNAAKYTPSRGTISIKAARENGMAVIRVRDNGVGIDPGMLERVFDVFTQVEQSIERSQGGLGLGLKLVKQLVELHGGSVEAKSEGSGRGSEFIVRFPILETADSNVISEAEVLVDRGTPRRVLVVDDSPDSRETMQMFLSLSGHTVELAEDGQQAVEKALLSHPEVAFVDIGLPKLNGYEVAKQIRKQPGGDRIVLIALSGYGAQEDKRKALEAGFDAHLTKPADLAAITKILNDLARATRPAP
jgi:signal transduction histidine kinase/ActR/RegA family two-component response regulator